MGKLAHENRVDKRFTGIVKTGKFFENRMAKILFNIITINIIKTAMPGKSKKIAKAVVFQPVIRVDKKNIIAPCGVKTNFTGKGGAKIGFVLENNTTAIFFGIAAANIGRGVGGSVVNKKTFKIAVLPGNAVKTTWKISGRVMDRDYN
jgi:hypothetical protein